VKGVEMGFKIPRKTLSTEGFARWAQNERPRGEKTLIFAKFCTLAPKTRFWVLFAVLSAKRAENRSWATFGPKNVPRCLCFTLFGARGEKDNFLLKSCCPAKRK